MLTLSEYLAQTPKKTVNKIFTRLEETPKGIVSNQEVISKVYQHYKTRNENLDLSKNINALALQLLQSIYLTGNKGLLETQIFSLSKKFSKEEIFLSIHQLKKNLWVYSLKKSNREFFGFEEFQKKILDHCFANTSIQNVENFSPVNYEYFFTNHLIHFLTKVRLGQIKITRQGELHRKSQKGLENEFSHGKHLSSSFPESELKWIYQTVIDFEWINFKGEDLIITHSGKQVLQQGIPELHSKLWTSWMKKNFHNNHNLFGYFFEKNQEFNIKNIAKYFSVYGQYLPDYYKIGEENSNKKTGLTWEQIPSVIQEMYFMGWINFGFSQGKIQSLFPNKNLQAQWVSNNRFTFFTEVPPPPKCLPNFEFYLAPNTGLYMRSLCEAFAVKKNDEIMTTYQFTKDAVINGLLSGFKILQLNELLNWIDPDTGISSTIREWAAKFDTCKFLQGVVIQVKNESQRLALENHPDFKTLILSSLTNFGFLLKPESKSLVKNILNQLDLYPGSEQINPIGEPLNKLFPTVELIEKEEEGEIEFDFLEEKKSVFSISKTKYQSKINKPSDLDKSRIIDYSIVADKLIELSFVGLNRKRLLIRPIRLLKDLDPSKLIAIEMETGHRKEFEVQNITSLRAVE